MRYCVEQEEKEIIYSLGSGRHGWRRVATVQVTRLGNIIIICYLLLLLLLPVYIEYRQNRKRKIIFNSGATTI